MTWMGTTPREASSIFIEGVMDTCVEMNGEFRRGGDGRTLGGIFVDVCCDWFIVNLVL